MAWPRFGEAHRRLDGQSPFAYCSRRSPPAARSQPPRPLRSLNRNPPPRRARPYLRPRRGPGAPTSPSAPATVTALPTCCSRWWTAPLPPSNRLPEAAPSSSTSSPRGDRPAAARLARWTPSTTTTRTMSRSSSSPGPTPSPRWTTTPGTRATTGSSPRPGPTRRAISTSAPRRPTSASDATAPSSPAAEAAPARTGPASSTS